MLKVKIIPRSIYNFKDSFPFDKPIPAKWYAKGDTVEIKAYDLITPEDDNWSMQDSYIFIVGIDCEVVEE